MRSLELELTPEESEKIAPRFWSKVKRGDDCWEWIGNSLKGRGLFKFKGRNVYSPRMAYALEVGSIQEGLSVCHTCDRHIYSSGRMQITRRTGITRDVRPEVRQMAELF